MIKNAYHKAKRATGKALNQATWAVSSKNDYVYKLIAWECTIYKVQLLDDKGNKVKGISESHPARAKIVLSHKTQEVEMKEKTIWNPTESQFKVGFTFDIKKNSKPMVVEGYLELLKEKFKGKTNLADFVHDSYIDFEFTNQNTKSRIKKVVITFEIRESKIKQNVKLESPLSDLKSAEEEKFLKNMVVISNDLEAAKDPKKPKEPRMQPVGIRPKFANYARQEDTDYCDYIYHSFPHWTGPQGKANVNRLFKSLEKLAFPFLPKPVITDTTGMKNGLYTNFFSEIPLSKLTKPASDADIQASLKNSEKPLPPPVPLSENAIRQIMIQLVGAVLKLHEEKITLRYLNPETITILKEPKTNYYVTQITDLSGCTFFNDPLDFIKDDKRDVYFNPEPFCSPEMVTGQYNSNSDVWALGMILYTLWTRNYPTWDKVVNFDFMKDDAFQQIPRDVQDLIIKMVAPETSRVHINKLFDDPWLNVNVNPNKRKGVKRDPEAEIPLQSIDLDGFLEYRELRDEQVTLMSMLYEFLPATMKAEVVQFFTYFDGNSNGRISYQELKEALLKIEDLKTIADNNSNKKTSKGNSDQKIMEIFQRLDSNPDGYVLLNELGQEWAYTKARHDATLMERLFKYIESSGNADGRISTADLDHFCNTYFNTFKDPKAKTKALQERIDSFKAWIMSADINEDHFISQEEFMALLKHEDYNLRTFDLFFDGV